MRTIQQWYYFNRCYGMLDKETNLERLQFRKRRKRSKKSEEDGKMLAARHVESNHGLSARRKGVKGESLCLFPRTDWPDHSTRMKIFVS